MPNNQGGNNPQTSRKASYRWQAVYVNRDRTYFTLPVVHWRNAGTIPCIYHEMAIKPAHILDPFSSENRRPRGDLYFPLYLGLVPADRQELTQEETVWLNEKVDDRLGPLAEKGGR